MVLGVDPTARRISLGLKQVESNPWHDLADKYPVGSKIQGKVRNLTEFGAFVEVEEDIDGLIHISDMSWSKRIKHPSEILKKGDVVEAMVLNIDAENQRLSLGLEAAGHRHLGRLLLAAPRRRHDRRQGRADDELRRVRRARRGHRRADSRVGVRRLAAGGKGEEKIELKVGETYPMKIIKLAPEERKIGLSIRALKSDEFRADWETVSGGRGRRHGDAGRSLQKSVSRNWGI